VTHPPVAGIRTFADWLYACVRCELSHSFALEWGHIEGPDRMAGIYVDISQRTGQPRINQNEFLEDFARGWNRYLGDVEGAAHTDPLRLNFMRRFDMVFHD
jgi:hypothetical protein